MRLAVTPGWHAGQVCSGGAAGLGPPDASGAGAILSSQHSGHSTCGRPCRPCPCSHTKYAAPATSSKLRPPPRGSPGALGMRRRIAVHLSLDRAARPGTIAGAGFQCDTIRPIEVQGLPALPAPARVAGQPHSGRIRRVFHRGAGQCQSRCAVLRASLDLPGHRRCRAEGVDLRSSRRGLCLRGRRVCLVGRREFRTGVPRSGNDDWLLLVRDIAAPGPGRRPGVAGEPWPGDARCGALAGHAALISGPGCLPVAAGRQPRYALGCRVLGGGAGDDRPGRPDGGRHAGLWPSAGVPRRPRAGDRRAQGCVRAGPAGQRRV